MYVHPSISEFFHCCRVAFVHVAVQNSKINGGSGTVEPNRSPAGPVPPILRIEHRQKLPAIVITVDSYAHSSWTSQCFTANSYEVLLNVHSVQVCSRGRALNKGLSFIKKKLSNKKKCLAQTECKFISVNICSKSSLKVETYIAQQFESCGIFYFLISSFVLENFKLENFSIDGSM